MKRAIIFLLEEIGYSIYMVYAFKHFPEYFEGVRVTAVFLIPMLSIAAVTLIQILLERKVESIIIARYGPIGEWIYPVIAVTATALVFFGFYIVLEHIGNMPASLRTLTFISVLSATAHLMFGEFLRILTSSEEKIAWEEDEFED